MVKILLVDDEQSILDAFTKFFDTQGFSVFATNSAKEALAILKSQKIDLAILDVLMPQVSGLELAMQIRKNPATKDLKIIFVSVLDAPRGDESKLMPTIHPSAWLQKPVDVEKLRKVVKQVMGNG
jgi:CheY-like chemotaxis protein